MGQITHIRTSDSQFLSSWHNRFSQPGKLLCQDVLYNRIVAYVLICVAVFLPLPGCTGHPGCGLAGLQKISQKLLLGLHAERAHCKLPLAVFRNVDGVLSAFGYDA